MDAKSKFVDLGTHIFYKDSNVTEKVTVRLADAIDNDLADEEVYTITLSDGMSDYQKLTDQGPSTSLVAKTGENVIKVDKSAYLAATQKFFKLPYQPRTIDVPLVGPLKRGELAIVLTYSSGK